MSHFTCPGSTTPHYIFGPPTSFRKTCSDLGLPILAEIPIEPTVSARGDQGSPIVMVSTCPTVPSSTVTVDATEESPPRVGEDSDKMASNELMSSTSARGAMEAAHPSLSSKHGTIAAFKRLAEGIWNSI